MTGTTALALILGGANLFIFSSIGFTGLGLGNFTVEGGKKFSNWFLTSSVAVITSVGATVIFQDKRFLLGQCIPYAIIAGADIYSNLKYKFSTDPKEFEISPDSISSYYDGEITIKGKNLKRDCKVTFEPSYSNNTSYVYEFKDIVWKNDNEFAVKFPAEPNDLADQSPGTIFYHLNGKKFNCGYFRYYKRKPIVESISPLFGSIDDKMTDIGAGIERRKFANWEIAEGDKLVIKGKFDDDTVVIFATKYGLQFNMGMGRIGYDFSLPAEGGTAILAIAADSVLINDNEIQVTVPSLESLKQHKNPWAETESIIDIGRTRIRVFNGKESSGGGEIFEFQYKQ